MPSPDRSLPYRQWAFVEDAKLGYYLAQARLLEPGAKAGLFREVLGFTDRADLRAALLAHAMHGAAVVHQRTRWGVIWNVDGLLLGPRRSIVMRSAWMIETGSRAPRNVTAFPPGAQRN